jgi:hypothetical protein
MVPFHFFYHFEHGSAFHLARLASTSELDISDPSIVLAKLTYRFRIIHLTTFLTSAPPSTILAMAN